MQIFLQSPEAHVLRHQRDSLLQGKIRRALCHLFPGDRTRHLPPCTGTVPQAHRHLASHGRRDQSQTVARTNLPPFLQRYRPNVPVQSETDSGLAENPESTVPQTETHPLGTGSSFLRPPACRNARPEARRIYLHRQRKPGRRHLAPGICRNERETGFVHCRLMR